MFILRRPISSLVAAAAATLLTLTIVPRSGSSLALAQAQSQDSRSHPVVGDTPAARHVQLIDNPGAYGLGPDLPGNRYATVAGHLVRIDASTGKILSVLRPIVSRPR
ncbi:MAG: hypothetical protein FJX25_07355 [Alphaproteobacteria bacterium]|nr:hypothetical protein [Alphaproteobacteria bacterium]